MAWQWHAVHAQGDRQHAGEPRARGRGAGEVSGQLQGDIVVVRVAAAQGPRHGLPPGPQGQEPDVRDAGLGDREAAEWEGGRGGRPERLPADAAAEARRRRGRQADGRAAQGQHPHPAGRRPRHHHGRPHLARQVPRGEPRRSGQATGEPLCPCFCRPSGSGGFDLKLYVWLQEEHLEIKERLNGSSRLRWSDVNSMPYTNKVMNETLRRATILPWYSRKAAQDFSIDGQWQRRPHRTGGQTATWTDAVESLTRRVRDQEGDVGEPGRGVHPPRPGRLRRPQPLRPQQIRRRFISGGELWARRRQAGSEVTDSVC
jgi:hypothetical protein